ncbi:MAG: acyl-CoA synthetase [Gammaproteobacteria bacterium]|nr:acyl-CoA synthetase [Gammaproteobacteria bacterium]
MEFSLAEVHDRIGMALGDREAIVFGKRRLRYRELAERSRRLANILLGAGLRVTKERHELAGHESGQDHLAIYLYNGNEYIEGMLGAFKARVAPLNINYRYVEEELIQLLRDSRARAILYHAEFAPTLGNILPGLPQLRLLIQVADGSGNALLPNAIDYEEALAASSPEPPPVSPSPDDLYIVYTGGTTGMPKGVLWRSADIFVRGMGGVTWGTNDEFDSMEAILERAQAHGTLIGEEMRSFSIPPLMHAGAQWSSFLLLAQGQLIIFQDNPRRLDPEEILAIVERERVNYLQIIGDAFARPILDAMGRGVYDLSTLKVISSGGAPLSSNYKEEFLERLPGVLIVDGFGASETGTQGVNLATRDSGASTGDFRPVNTTLVLSDDLIRPLGPGEPEIGWLAQCGRVPLGYLGDAAKSARTFPTIDGVRYAVPGDRARYRSDGSIEILGREAVTINSGGEKIFAEEVEHALKHHPAVFDAVVCGRQSERWGQEVVAIVQLRAATPASEQELLDECARHIARYKLPKSFVFLDKIVRSPTGKADYRWARAQVSG